MHITGVRVFPVTGKEKLKAFVSIIIDDCFIVSDIKIVEGADGRLFLSMPSKRHPKTGEFRDIVHPLNRETRQDIEDKVFAMYREMTEGGGAPPPDEDREEFGA
jgi:stage V sporulation protein G